MIEVKDITKCYIVKKKKEGKFSLFKKKEEIEALKQINFTLKGGETTCILGANGAGKSTLIKIMTGILTPDSGNILINGQSPFENRTQFLKNLGIVFGQRTQLWWELPVIDSFNIIKKMYDVDDKTFERNLDILDQYFQIKRFLHRTVRSLSLGQRMLCDLASTFLHDPSVIFLDEPTIGLDVSIKNKMYEFIRYLNASTETSIILTTHDMSDIRALSDRVIIIDKGSILFDGKVEQVSNIFKEIRMVTVELLDEDTEQLNTLIESHQFGTHISKSGVITIEVNTSSHDLNGLLSELHSIMPNLSDVKIELPDIEYVLTEVYGGGLNE